MKFIHPHFGIEIDTEDTVLLSNLEKLESLYSELPKTVCQKCPKKKDVQSDCCKVFSPPMNLIEFINIFRDIQKLSEEKIAELTYACILSFLNPDYFKTCVLLDSNLCSIYVHRPLSCRLFGMYTEAEYKERVVKVSKQIPMYVEIPFKEQCKNMEYEDDKKEVFRGHSDRIFKDIHELDIQMFSGIKKSDAKDIVMSSCTYMPFDAHYLCVVMGPEFLETLTEFKMSLRKAKDALMIDKDNFVNQLDFKKKENQIKEFCEIIKKSIIKEKNEQL